MANKRRYTGIKRKKYENLAKANEAKRSVAGCMILIKISFATITALSIIFNNEIEARTFNNTHDLEKNKQYDIITTPVNKRSVKANATNGNNTVLMKKIYNYLDQRSDINAESRNIFLTRNKYDRKYKHKGNEEADSDKSQAEQQSDDNIKSNAKITSNRIELTSSDNRNQFSNEATCSEETNKKRKLVAEVMAQTIAIERDKQEGKTKLEPNDESLQNYEEKDHHPTVKPVPRQKQLKVKPRYTKIRTTKAMREKEIIPKITHKRYSEVENEICKTKHCDYKNHRSFEKISREHDVYKLKRRDEFKTASKGNNKKKHNMKQKHRHSKSHRAFITQVTQPQENAQYKLKHRDIKKPVLSNSISEENDIYVRKHKDDSVTVDEIVTGNHERKYIDDSATVEEPVSKQVKNPKYKPKFSNNFQEKRQRDKKVSKVRHTDKTKRYSKTKKHDSEKVISKQDKYKPTLKEDRDYVFETHTNIRKGDNEINVNSGDILNPDDADTPTIENQDERDTLESYEEILNQNDLLNKPKLPFYVSSTTKRAIKEIFKKQPKKLVAWKNKREMDILLDDLNSVLKGNKVSINQNIDLNTTISRLASSKILDFITDRLAGQMLKKLENNLAAKNNLRTKELMNPEKIEQIDILLKKNGDMVILGPEHVKEKEEGFREAFYP